MSDFSSTSFSDQVLVDTGCPAGIKQRAIQVRLGDSLTDSQDLIASEAAVAVVFNGVSHAVMMATPENLEEFAMGFSFTEGIVRSAVDVRSVEVNTTDLGIELDIQISTACFENLKHRRRQLSGRTGCGLCGLSSLKAAMPDIRSVMQSALPSYAVIQRAMAELSAKQVLQKQCGAVHAAALVDGEGDILFLREDVGRHNALDKLIGKYLIEKEPVRRMGSSSANAEGVCPRDVFILVSSRASFEMVFKAATLGVSTLVAVSAPTSMAIKLAKQAGMNLIGFVRDGRQIIYHDATLDRK